MKKLFTVILMALAFPHVATAQAVLAHTTLSAAMTDSRTLQLSVAAAGTIAADMIMIIDHEAAVVDSISGTVVTLENRGYSGTTASSHASGAVVMYGVASRFYSNVPSGSCTAANEIVLPRVSIDRGAHEVRIFNCNNSQWVEQSLPDDLQPTLTRYCTLPGLGLISQLTTFGDANAPLVLGNNQTPVAGTLYYGTIELPRTMRLTGVSVLNGTVAGTDDLKVVLFRANGAPVAYSELLAATGTDRFQDVPFTAVYLATGRARYWVGVSANGTTTRLRNVNLTPVVTTAGLGAFIGMLGSSATSTFGTLGTANLIGGLGLPANTATTALPTSLISRTAPIACVY